MKLEEVDLDDVVIDRCTRCAGLWFDNDEIGNAVGVRAGLRDLESSIPPPHDEVAAVICPRCPEVALRRLAVDTSAGKRPAVIFRCASCAGTWIDRGELGEQEDPGLIESLTA
ncbi:MAG: zf-TFIIB domain-containing protein, partial [Deltaproteobacteria bacterium]|nr:zf-TFIIB domain-containing protein [Deltaproteobacteria bacterium]